MTTTANSRLVNITDHRGTLLLPSDDLIEPLPGSILLTEGRWGTAWQRFFSDGRWHPVRGGGSATWETLITRRNVVLVYDADERAV